MTGQPRKPSGSVTVKKRLADGSVKSYTYAKKERADREPFGVPMLAAAYKASPEYSRLAHNTRKIYDLYLLKLIDELGWMRLSYLQERPARAEFYEVRDKLRDVPHSADMMMKVLSVLLDWGVDRGHLEINMAKDLKRLGEHNSRADITLSPGKEVALLGQCDADMAKVVLFALYTGTRRGDLCDLSWANVSDGWLSFVPEKTKRLGIRVEIPIEAYPPLKALIDSLPRGARLLTRKGHPWTRRALTKRWAAMNTDMHFHDLRGTLATRLLEAGCSDAEVAAVLGKRIGKGTITAYASRSRVLAENAYRKLALGPESAVYWFAKKPVKTTGLSA